MSEMNWRNQEKEIKQLYERYKTTLLQCRSYEELLEVCALLYEDMELINNRNGFWDALKGCDSEAVYYIAEHAMAKCGSLGDMKEKTETEKHTASGEDEKRKFASALYGYICNRRKIRFHIIEPHADDALGSACGICYNSRLSTVLHTLCESGDARDGVSLDEPGRKKYGILRKSMNIVRHEKYMLPDFHYDLRIQNDSMPFQEKAESYLTDYPALDRLRSSIRGIVEEAAQEDAYISFPTGLEHPMHILTMLVCMECIAQLQFDKNKVVIYVDHPYDFQWMDTDRMAEVRQYLDGLLSGKLIRYDDIGAGQEQVQKVIEEVYGSMHFGEFDGSLDRTLCSYYITETGYKALRDIFKLRCHNILYISAQAWPFYKTGGLGEVAYGYCSTLQSAVNDVRILLPGYLPDEGTDLPGRHLRSFTFTYEHTDGEYACEIEKRAFHGLIFYRLSIWDSSGRQIDFASEDGSGRKFAVFCDAVLQKGLDTIDYFPTICHCNDWQTALIPFLKKTKYRNYRRDLKTVYTVHFYGYKGIFPKKEVLSQIGINRDTCNLCIVCGDECIYNKIDLLNKTAKGELLQTIPSLMSCMRAGIEFADAVTTVSKGYAEEIQQYPDFTDVKVTGIRNGIMPCVEKSGDVHSHGWQDYDGLLKYKKESKRTLQRMLHLEVKEDIPVICMVSRLAVEKGTDLIKNMLPFLLKENVQMIITGDDSDRTARPYANYFGRIEKESEGQFAYRAYSEELEHKVYAGADILLMPSLSEACGTTQMKAMQYGVIPVVSMLSAFRDSVLDYRNREQRKNAHWDKGIGFYAYRDDCWVFMEVLKKVLEIYHAEPKAWREISRICSETDFSWKNKSIYEYLNLYSGLTGRE